MKAHNNSDASTGEKMDASDHDVGIHNIDDEFFERACAQDSKLVWRAIKRLELDVLRGVRSVRAEIDSDTQNGLAQQAYDRFGGHARKAFKLGRQWALSHRPSFSEVALHERRFEERRRREDARLAKQAEDY